MEDASIARISSIPWVAALLNDPKWTRTRTASRLLKASGEDSFFAETLATDRTVRACLTFKPTNELEEELAYREIRTVVDLGDGLNGYPQICHGGFVATLLDEVCGVVITLNMEKRMERLKKTGPVEPHKDMAYMTAYLNTTYKKPVPTPGALLCTAKIDRREGRKLFVRATIEDGHGTVYTLGEAMFIEVKASL